MQISTAAESWRHSDIQMCQHARSVGHETRAISFTLVVDDVRVKYVRKEDVNHLIASKKATYSLTEDWTGNMHCGITLDWDYENRHINISMPGYIKKIARIRPHNAQKIVDMPILTRTKMIGN